MQLGPLVRAVRRQRRTLTACTIAGGLVALGLDWHTGPTFAANSQLFVAATQTGSVDAAYLAQRVQTYAGLATSHELLDAVASDIPVADPASLAERITATAAPGTVLIDLRVVDASPVRARSLADSVATHLAAMAQKLETPANGNPSPIRIEVTSPASASITPVGPQRTRDIGLGALAGLLLATLWAATRALGDRAIRIRAQLDDLGVPVLAEISEDALASKLPLIVTDPFSPRAEAFRRLRTNLRARSDAAGTTTGPTNGNGQPRSIVVTSPMPGEGRTTTACNLAIALAQNGEEVVLVDADLRRGAVADMLGLSAGIGLTNVLAGERPLAQALHPWRQELPLRVLPTGPLPPNPSEVAGSAQLVALINSLTAGGLSVVLDSPPLLPVTDAALLANATDGAVVVVQAGATTTADLRACLEALETSGARVLGIALNRARGRALSLPPAAASPRRRRTPAGRPKTVADVGTPGGRLAPPDTIAGSVTSWTEQQAAAMHSTPSAASAPPEPFPVSFVRPSPAEIELPEPIANEPVAPAAATHEPGAYESAPYEPVRYQSIAGQPLAPLPPELFSVPTSPVSTSPMPTGPTPTVPRQASPRDAVDPLASPPASPPAMTPQPTTRREARRRLAAVPDVETHEMQRIRVQPASPTPPPPPAPRPFPVDLRETRISHGQAEPTASPAPQAYVPGPGDLPSVWAPPPSGFRGA